ncbi:MAG: GPW/gp25 family protein [Ardenticatenaceae bacterium]|nr:GPW/gp25 family protein [Ardenticatenaceae bacterium]
MDEGTLFGRGISFPPRLGADGRWAWSAGPENVREAIRVILLTENDERLMRPAFGGGLQPFLFEPNTVATQRLLQERIVQALRQWEPRIELQDVAVAADPDEPQTAVVTIRYKLVATRASEQMNFTLRLAA